MAVIFNQQIHEPSNTREHMKETQSIRSPWIWILLFAAAAIPWIGIYVQEGLGEPFGNNPISTTGLVALGLLLFALLYWLWTLKLVTEGNNEHLAIQFGIFGSRKIPWTQLERIEVVPYVSMGYGYRLSFKYGTIFRAGGKFGVAMTLKSGEKLMFSTQQPEQWRTFLNQHHAH